MKQWGMISIDLKVKPHYFSLRTKDWKEAVKLRDKFDYELGKFGTILGDEPEENVVYLNFGNYVLNGMKTRRLTLMFVKTHWSITGECSTLNS